MTKIDRTGCPHSTADDPDITIHCTNPNGCRCEEIANTVQTDRAKLLDYFRSLTDDGLWNALDFHNRVCNTDGVLMIALILKERYDELHHKMTVAKQELRDLNDYLDGVLT